MDSDPQRVSVPRCSCVPRLPEVTRRIQELVETWGASFIRMTLEKDESSSNPAVSDFSADSPHLQVWCTAPTCQTVPAAVFARYSS